MYETLDVKIDILAHLYAEKRGCLPKKERKGKTTFASEVGRFA